MLRIGVRCAIITSLFALGCDPAPEISSLPPAPSASASAAQVTLASQEAQPANSPQDLAAEPKDGATESVQRELDPSKAQASSENSKPSPEFEFEPPFPARPNPFARPDRDNQVAVEPRGDDNGSTVVLHGFAKVGQQRAVLLIDGELATLAEGQTKHGVFVMEIAPPEVTLRRGRYVWTTSLQRPETSKQRR